MPGVLQEAGDANFKVHTRSQVYVNYFRKGMRGEWLIDMRVWVGVQGVGII